jgi:hypothetical protein
MKQVIHYSEGEARDFFERLATYSAEYVRVAIPQVHRHWPSGNHYDAWQLGHPIGNVLHYTAGVSYAGTIRHFVFGNRVSSHVVIAKALDRRFDELRKDLELDVALQAECVQIVPPTVPSWHAGWVNRLCYGIEVRNAGVLRPSPKKRGEPGAGGVSRRTFFEYPAEKWDVDDLDFYWWYRGWTSKFEGEVIAINGSWWESWSRGSLATAIVILRYLNALYPGELDPVFMLAHHMQNKAKNDVVLPVDLDLFRNAVLYSNEHVDDLDWLAEYDDCEDGFEDLDDPWMLRELDERQADRAEEDLEGEFDPFAGVDKRARISGTVDSSEEGVEALRRLGFFVANEDAVRRSARIYQRGRDLEVDGVIGPSTLAALDRDLRTWGLK